MLILLEGGEGVGKTTLANELVEGLGDATYTHYSSPTRHPLMDYCLDTDWYRPREAHLVLDRAHLSEEVYGLRYRGKSLLGREGFWYVEAYLRSRGAILVRLTDSPQAIAERLSARTAETGDAGYATANQDAVQLIADFDRVGRLSCLPQLVYGFGEARHEEILAEAAEAELAVAALTDFPGYIGPADPEVLLLGAERPVGRRNSLHVTPFAPYPDSSGRYLILTLLRHFVQPCNIGVANALENDLHSLVDALGSPMTICLGKDAHAAAEKIGLPHSTVPHPQYNRRFHWHRPSLYQKAIVNAIDNPDSHVFSFPIPPAGQDWERDPRVVEGSDL